MIDWTETGVMVTADWWTLSLWVGLVLAIPFSGWVIWRAWRRMGRSTGDLPALGFDLVATWIGTSLAGRLMLWAVLVGFGLLFVLAIGASFRLVFAVAFQPPEAGAASLGLGALLVALLGAPFLIWRSVVAQRTVDVAQDNFLLTQQGQVTQRINEAVQALGTVKIVADRERPNMEVRIGAILALGRIARENLDFHVQVMQILCAYIRENSKAADAKPVPTFQPPTPEPADDLEAWGKTKEEYRKTLADWTQSIPIRADIQTALDVIGRRNPRQISRERGWPVLNASEPCPFLSQFPVSPDYPGTINSETHSAWLNEAKEFQKRARELISRMQTIGGYKLDLRNTSLQGYNFEELDFSAADFRGAQLQCSSLRAARFRGVDFQDARLQGVFLSNAQMQGSNLTNAVMDGSIFFYTDLTFVTATNASLMSCEIMGSTFSGVKLEKSSLVGSFLMSNKLDLSILKSLKLDYAKGLLNCMHGTILEDISLRDSDFRFLIKQENEVEDSLRFIYLTLVNFAKKLRGNADPTGGRNQFFGASLRNLKWSAIDLKESMIIGTFGDASVDLPFSNPDRWPNLELSLWPTPDKRSRSAWQIEFDHWQSNPDTYDWSQRRQHYTDAGQINLDNPPPGYQP